MASLTIRKLDDAVKTYLRLRSAGNGRSVEDEVRVILRDLIQGQPDSRRQLHRLARACQRLAPPSARMRTGQARVTLIIGGGIAAFKSLELIRRLKERRIDVRCVLTRAAQQFVTPLSASALSHERVYTDLFDPESEFDAGHIRLARECDLIVVAPATADLMAKMAQGHADDLASAILLAADRPILLAPAMNPLMWNNAATRRNVLQLRARRRHHDRPECRRDGRSQRGRRRTDVGGDGNCGRRRSTSCARRSPRPLRGQARADHRGPDP